MPPFFDKKRLHTEEFKRFIYKGKRGVPDMNLAGYKLAIKDVLAGTEIRNVIISQVVVGKVLETSRVADDNKDGDVKIISLQNVWVSVVVGVKLTTGEVYEACGEANYDELSDNKTENAMVRIAESRGIKRACARALGIAPEDFFPPDSKRRSHLEDIDTPLADLESEDKDGRVQPLVREEREKVSLRELAD